MLYMPMNGSVTSIGRKRTTRETKAAREDSISRRFPYALLRKIEGLMPHSS